MNYGLAISDISERMSDGWTHPIVWDNTYWNDEGYNDPWAKVEIRHNRGNLAALGNHLYDQSGTVFIYLHVLTGRGLAPFIELVEHVKESFRRTGSGKVWYRNVSVNELGEDGRWYRVLISAEFQYYEVR